MNQVIDRLRSEGWTPAKLSAAMTEITPQAISQWRQVPHDRVIEVERVTGISRHELRPDLSRIFIGAPQSEDAA